MLADAYLTYEFIRRFVTPFRSWRACKLGIIDADGNVLKKRRDLVTDEERHAFGTFDLLVLNIKRAIPRGSGSIVPAALSLAMTREGAAEEVADLAALLMEDSPPPTNVVGTGAIAGAGVGPQGEPGKRVPTDGKKRFRRIRDALARRVDR